MFIDTYAVRKYAKIENRLLEPIQEKILNEIDERQGIREVLLLENHPVDYIKKGLWQLLQKTHKKVIVVEENTYINNLYNSMHLSDLTARPEKCLKENNILLFSRPLPQSDAFKSTLRILQEHIKEQKALVISFEKE